MDINSKLKTEIDSLIYKTNLNELLNSYGELFIVGSYVYDLMTWRDFDMVLKVDLLNDEIINSIIETIKTKINPSQIKIFNNIYKENNNRPIGYWIGIYIEDWKIDLWVMDVNNANLEKQKNEGLSSMLLKINKDELIKFKQELGKDNGYHKKFSSVDVYKAYVIGNIKTIDGFYNWMELNTLN